MILLHLTFFTHWGYLPLEEPLIIVTVTLELWRNYYSQRFNDSSKLTWTNFLNTSGYLWLAFTDHADTESEINILSSKRFRDCGLPCIKSIQPAVGTYRPCDKWQLLFPFLFMLALFHYDFSLFTGHTITNFFSLLLLLPPLFFMILISSFPPSTSALFSVKNKYGCHTILYVL